MKRNNLIRRRLTLAGLAVGLAVLGGAGCTKEARKARHLERAESSFKAEQYEKAELDYLNVLRFEPTNHLAIRRLGFIYHQEGDLRKAMGFLRKALSQDTNNLEVHLTLGLTHLAWHDLKNARSEAEFILARQPAQEEALVLLADAAGATPPEVDQTLERLRRLAPQAGAKAGYQLALGTLSLRKQDVKAAESAFRQALSLNPQSSAAHGALGNLCLLSNDLKQAEQHFKKAAELAPLRSAWRMRYADFKLEVSEVEESKRILNDVVKKAPADLPALQRLGQIALVEKRFADCAAVVARITSRAPDNYEAQLLSARLRLAQGDTAKAVTELEQMSKQHANVPKVHYTLAVAHLANGDPTRAVSSLHQATLLDTNYTAAALLLAELNLQKGDYAAAIPSLNGLIRRQPWLFQAHLSLATAYQGRKDPDNALAVYQRMTELFPRSAEPYFQSGLVWRGQRKPAEARKAFESALALLPDDVKTLEQLAELDVAQNRADAAAQRIQQAIERNPKAPPLRMVLANVQMAAGQTNQAEATLEKMIELEPQAQGAGMMLAQVYVANNKPAQALDKLQALTRKNPKNAQAFLYLGMLQEQKKDYRAARDAYERALVAQPRLAPALNNLLCLYSEQLGQLDTAYELANKSKEILLSHPGSTDTMGWILCQRGEPDRALPLLQEAAAKLPGEPEVLFHLGMAHYMTAQEAPARLAFQRALETKKEFKGKAEAEQRLAFLNMDFTKADAATVSFLEGRVSAKPVDPVALSHLAAVYEQSGAPDKAIQAYEKAIKANPTAVGLTLKLAQLYGDKPDSARKALELARTARNLAPNDPNVTHLLGRLACRTGDPQWALNLLQESAQKLGKDPEVLFDLARALYHNARITEAETTMQSALSLNPAFPRAAAARRFLAFSTLYANPAKAQQALPQIQETLKAEPDDLPALMASGVLHEQAKNIPAAKQTYERILALSPTFSPAVRQVVMLSGDTPDEQKRAYELGLKIREAYAQDADLARRLGLLAYRRDEFGRAVGFLKESARARPNDAEVFYYLGMAHFQLKARTESAEALRQALALNLKAPMADEARRVLATLK